MRNIYLFYLPELAAALVCALALSIYQHDPFFWDTLQLASRHAHFFYENDLKWAVLPSEMDSGHPPLFGYYLAVVWKVAGKSLVVSHWAMFPFLSLAIAQLYRIGTLWATPPWAVGLVALAICDPVFAGQSALVSPDVALTAFFLLAVRCFLQNRLPLAAIALAGMACISMRGMLAAGGLGLWQVIVQWRAGEGVRWRSLIFTFLPAGLLAFAFLAWHYVQAGWIGHHPDSPWAPAFQRVGIAGLVRNIAVVGWRWVDFGRVVEWIVLAVAIWRLSGKPGEKLVFLWISMAVFLLPTALLYQNLTAHRYFWPWFMSGHFIVFCAVFSLQASAVWKRGLLGLAIAGLIIGNCWIYPRGISMGWDATLAHRPYHSLRNDMLAWMAAENIPMEKTGSAFPNLATGEITLLNGQQRAFAEKDFKDNHYMLVSNIFNDFNKNDFDQLSRWILVKRLEKNGVWMELYQKPL